MKRIVVLLVVALAVSFAAFADEATVIDFNKLVADFPADKPVYNQATIMDFSGVAGSSFTDAEKAAMKTSLAIENWDVLLNNSANSVVNASDSFARSVKVKSSATKYANETVMGIRVRFPTEAYNAYVEVRPPFEIPAYMDKTSVNANGALEPVAAEKGKGSKFDGFGVVKNVGVVKSISVTVFGNNFPHRLSVVLKDQANATQEWVMGYMNFDGWRTLTIENSNYIQDVRDRDIRVYPMYPTSFPSLKIDHFKVYKDASMTGGDFVAYVKDVKIVYDKAILLLERDIDDEATWGILQDREESRRNAELKRLGDLQVRRFLESRKMASETTDTAAPAPAAK